MALSRRTGILSLLAAFGAGLAGCSPATTPTSAPSSPASTATGTATVADPLPAGPVTALLCGTDSDKDTTNTDVLVVAQLSADRRKVTLVSIPRDSYVPIAGGASNKINSALSTHGIDGLKRTVSDLFGGLELTYVLQTNFTDFIRLCEAFGTFSVQNRVASSVTSTVTGKVTRFPAGPLSLEGADWLIYARQRKGLPGGDFDRGERHRAIVTGMINQAKKKVDDAKTFAALVRDAAAHVRLHGGLTAANAYGLGAALRSIDSGSITSLRIPTKGTGNEGNVVDVVYVDTAKLASLASGLRAGDVSAYVAANPQG